MRATTNNGEATLEEHGQVVTLPSPNIFLPRFVWQAGEGKPRVREPDFAVSLLSTKYTPSITALSCFERACLRVFSTPCCCIT